MKSIFSIFIFSLCFVLPGYSQIIYEDEPTEEEMGQIVLEEVSITAHRPTRRQKEKFKRKQRRFNKMRYNVMKVWPFVNVAAKNLSEINSALYFIEDEKERKAFLKTKEKTLFGEYEDDIRDLTFSQGKILIKLIDRQTGNTTYSLIKDLKSGTSAFFWQTIGKLFGYDLKKEYVPDEDDLVLEAIVQSIESGVNPTYFDVLECMNKTTASKR